MKCPKCGATGENIDWRADEGWNIQWNCFECEHEWMDNSERDKK